jgi:hypothetical protein
MPPSVPANSRVPFLSNFSAADRQLFDKTLEQRKLEAQKAGDARGAKAARARESAAKAMRDMLGAANQRSLREFMQGERQALRAALQPPGGLEQSAGKLRQAMARKSEATLRRLGVDKAKLAGIAAKYHEALSALEPAVKAVPGFHRRSNLKKWRGLSKLHDPSFDWDTLGDIEPDTSDPHRWFVFQPPFFGFNFKFVPVHNEHFIVDRLHHLDPSAGLVGHQVTMDTPDDVDDFDYASGQADTQIAFGFVPPVAGLIEVLIDAQCVECRHELRTEDRWGWSDSTTSQINYLSLDVLHPNTPNISLAEMSRFVKSTDDDTNTVQQNLILGDHYFAQLRSSGPLLAGQSVVVCIGTRNFDKSGANDVEIHSKSIFRWFIRSVEVRVMP